MFIASGAVSVLDCSSQTSLLCYQRKIKNKKKRKKRNLMTSIRTITFCTNVSVKCHDAKSCLHLKLSRRLLLSVIVCRLMPDVSEKRGEGTGAGDGRTACHTWCRYCSVLCVVFREHVTSDTCVLYLGSGRILAEPLVYHSLKTDDNLFAFRS